MIINKQGTFRPFATPLCVYPPPFLAIHHCLRPPPQCSSGVDAIVTEKQLPSDSGVTAETAKSMSDAADRRHSLNASLLVLIAVYSLYTAAALVS